MPRLSRAEFVRLTGTPRAKRRVALGRVFRPGYLDRDLLNWPFPIEPEALVARFAVPGDPVAKARPRLGRNGNVYTPDATVAWEARIKARLALVSLAAVDESVRLGVRIRFLCSTRSHADADNLVKAVWDSCNRRIYPDDGQIDRMEAEVERDVADESAGVEVIVYRLDRLAVSRARGLD